MPWIHRSCLRQAARPRRATILARQDLRATFWETVPATSCCTCHQYVFPSLVAVTWGTYRTHSTHPSSQALCFNLGLHLEDLESGQAKVMLSSAISSPGEARSGMKTSPS